MSQHYMTQGCTAAGQAMSADQSGLHGRARQVGQLTHIPCALAGLQHLPLTGQKLLHAGDASAQWLAGAAGGLGW